MTATKPQNRRLIKTTTKNTPKTIRKNRFAFTSKPPSTKQAKPTRAEIGPKIYLRINFTSHRITTLHSPTTRLKLPPHLLQPLRATRLYYRPSRSKATISLLNRAYSTAVAPLISRLAQEKTIDSKGTYGELSPSFIDSLLREFKISGDKGHSFVDLGSGVGNVVMQVALATGCRALGCEIDRRRHAVALEFRTALERLLADGGGSSDARILEQQVTLVCGDVFCDPMTLEAVKNAELIVSANLKFGPGLVTRQVKSVLEQMKPGAVFVSLEKVVRGSRFDCRTTLEALGVREEQRVSEEWAASWTSAPVSYWVYRKSVAELSKEWVRTL